METKEWLLTPAQGVSRTGRVKPIAGSAGRATTERSKEGTALGACFLHPKAARVQTQPHGLFGDLTENVPFQSRIKNTLPHGVACVNVL